jgi:hypothetical protein
VLLLKLIVLCIHGQVIKLDQRQMAWGRHFMTIAIKIIIVDIKDVHKPLTKQKLLELDNTKLWVQAFCSLL